MTRKDDKAYRHPEAGRLYIGRPFIANDTQFPSNWLELATDEDLTRHGITTQDDPTLTSADIAQELEYARNQQYYADLKQGQYAALGRFVQNFELMIGCARHVIYMMLRNDGTHNDDINILINHRSLTARPLLEICESMLSRRFFIYQEAAEEDIVAARKILKQISKEWRELEEMRNAIVHATWRIGWGLIDGSIETTIPVHKYSHSASEKSGFKAVNLPTSIEDLDCLSGRCGKNGELLQRLWTCIVIFDTPRILKNFRQTTTGKWEGTA